MEIAILILLLVAAFWHAAMRARELGIAIAKQACRDLETKLLDDTVLLSHLGLKRGRDGRYGVRRIYTFRYLDHQAIIHHGAIIMQGIQQEALLLDIDAD